MKRPAEAEASEPAAKKVAPAGDEKPEGEYKIHDNGGRPFKVSVKWPGPKAEVQIFKAVQDDDDEEVDDEEKEENDGNENEGNENEGNEAKGGESGGPQIRVLTAGEIQQLGGLFKMAPGSPGEDSDEGGEEEVTYEAEPCKSFSAEKVFVGQCPKHIFAVGNSILLHLEGLKYVFVGENVFSFVAKSPITKYFSPIGNNDVPYPWAMDEQGLRYLMISSVLLSSKLFEKDDTDPYELFFNHGLITPDIGMVPEEQPFHKQFQGITEFWIGEDQYTMKYEAHPEEDFDRLAEMGELSVVKDGAKIKMSKADYVKLMQDFGEMAGFEAFHSETLVERNI